MRKILICFMILILTGMSGEAPQTQQTAAFDGEIVRLHVIANSNSEADQRLKLKVRDAVLEAAGDEISEAKTEEGLNRAVKNRLSLIETAAAKVIADEGGKYGVTAEFGVFEFPARTYGNITYPAGEYNAVRIVIGEGAGNNWWCVLFPPLCFTDESYTATANIPEENGKKFEAKFKIAEVLGL